MFLEYTYVSVSGRSNKYNNNNNNNNNNNLLAKLGYSSASSADRATVEGISDSAHHLRDPVPLVVAARPRLFVHVPETQKRPRDPPASVREWLGLGDNETFHFLSQQHHHVRGPQDTEGSRSSTCSTLHHRQRRQPHDRSLVAQRLSERKLRGESSFSRGNGCYPAISTRYDRFFCSWTGGRRTLAAGFIGRLLRQQSLRSPRDAPAASRNPHR